MGLFDKLFNKKTEQENSNNNSGPEHSVIIRFNYGLETLDQLHQLEDELDSVLQESGHGDCDGHEIATDMSDGILYLYGSNAETVFETIKPILDNCSFMKGAIAKLQFGPPEEGVREIEIPI